MKSARKASNYSSRVFYEPREDEYIAISPEFPGSSGFGPTAERAISDLAISVEGMLHIYRQEYRELPVPREPENSVLREHEMRVRIPESLYLRLGELAAHRRVPQDRLMIQLLDEGVRRAALPVTYSAADDY